MWQIIYLTQDIGRGLSKIKREGEIKMYVISHHRFEFGKWIKKCDWTETFPIDQLVDDNNMLLKFETKEDAMDTLKLWGVNVSIALQEGLRIESVN